MSPSKVAVRGKTSETLERNIERMVQTIIGQHYINSPTHAAALVGYLDGHFHAMRQSKEDDPLLYAYMIRDELRRCAPLIIALQRWVDAVIDSTPDQIQESGAQICRTTT